MKTIAKTLVGWAAVAVILSAQIVAASPLSDTSVVWLGAVVVGQAGANDTPAGKEAKAADLLQRARQAMAESNLAAAESLIAQAEALDVSYGTFYFGDTPKKARRDLEHKRAAASSPTKPSQLFAPLGLGKKDTPPSTDPFAGRVPPTSAGVLAGTTAANAGQVTPLPKVDATATTRLLPPSSFPSTSAATLPLPGESDIRSLSAKPMQAPIAMPQTAGLPQGVQVASPAATAAAARQNSPLRDARLALAVGDVRRADMLVQQARAVRRDYQPLEDTPDKVAATVAKYQELSTLNKESEVYRRAYARSLTEQAGALMQWREYDEAERLASRAVQMHIVYGPFEAKPHDLLQQIAAARRPGSNAVDRATAALGRDADVVAASGQMPLGANGVDQGAAHAVYDPNNDATRNVQAADQQPTARTDQRTPANAAALGLQPPLPPEVVAAPAPTPGAPAPAAKSSAMTLFQQGEAALRAHDSERAYQLFVQAEAQSAELDPATAQRLHERLQLLSAASRTRAQAGQTAPLADAAAAKQMVLAQQVAADLANTEANARALLESNPQGALAKLEEAKQKVEKAGLEPTTRDRFVRQVNRAIDDAKRYIEQNRPQLELAQKNKKTEEEVARGQQTRVEIKEKIALLVDECNRLMYEQRYAEAEVAAKRAAELDPQNPVVVQLQWQTKFVRRYRDAKAIEDAKENGFLEALADVDRSSIPFPADKNPMVFPDAKSWDKISAGRKKYAADPRLQRSEQEIEIDQKLRTPVSLNFNKAPLREVMDYLRRVADVNLYLDPAGLAAEGIDPDTPVTIEVHKEIMLKSALNLILEPLHLSYITKDQVLKITSEQMRDGNLETRVYNVADLVIPIPNFVPGAMGLQRAYNTAMEHVGLGGAGLPFGANVPPASLAMTAGRDGHSGSGVINPTVLAQMTSTPRPTTIIPKNTPQGDGPGGMGGGGAQADFSSLIDLITSTISPNSWSSVGGGPAPEPQPFETNLSLVISQTQENHEKIADLLDQLRRLQDLQVTVEVRFITLSDKFFERVGVSFDFDIGANTNGSGVQIVSSSNSNVTGGTTTTTDRSRAITVGMSSPTTFTSDYDIAFTQNSYSLAVPQYGGYDASAGASLGFAILSDIEAYFFITAAQGDRRSNVLQAPKVTLFNGQTASVNDTTQSPFVVSVIPVVGDFAAAQQPVVVVLSEGTFLSVQAVVSADRRFVRMTVVPFFSTIGEVNTFTFSGTDTTTTDSSRSGLQSAATDPSKLWNNKSDSTTTTSTGTTVQLPSYSSFSVSTTVSVPDGGTILLGGIKRLSEGRNEFGVPGLDKIPYVNRLFRNVAIGRETSSLMMMVTPRIIIQEEEEEKLGVEPEE